MGENCFLSCSFLIIIKALEKGAGKLYFKMEKLLLIMVQIIRTIIKDNENSGKINGSLTAF